MKTNNPLHRLTALLPVLLLATACTRDDGFAPSSGGDTTPAALTISVTDGGYALADAAPGTRAVERGYGTEFTAGDQIGLYVVEVADPSNTHSDRKFLHQNLCLTYDGTAWTLPPGTDLTHCPPPGGGEVLYFAYYPYQGDMTGKVKLEMLDTMGMATFEAKWFFWPLIVDWYPAADQSTYEAYTASDLMTAKGKVTARTDGTDGSVLSFGMEHQMALVVVRVPTTKCTYKETVSGVEQEKSYHLYSNFSGIFWKENHHTVRLLWKLDNTLVGGSYYSTSGEHEYSFVISRGSISPGTYKLFTIDGGGEKVIARPLSVGDFYMKDGTILPKESVPVDMPREMQEDCLGIVFSTTDPTPSDPLLRRHHPACNHGTVIALKDAHQGVVWSNRTDIAVNDWTNSDDRGEDKVDISNLRVLFGYSNTYALHLYNKAHAAGFGIAAVAEVDRYGKSTPAPANSSGWYLPGMELGVEDAHREIEASFQKAGGEALDGNQNYWTSIEWSLSIAIATTPRLTYTEGWKKDTFLVRAMLAF